VKSLAWIVCMKRFKIYVQSDFRTKATPLWEEKIVGCRGHMGYFNQSAEGPPALMRTKVHLNVES
jgi:hypothetical protein